jgi:predicted alpha/beta superfamily hydrolase
LGHTRKILVYLPPGYSQADPWRYPVVYAQDGQNLFNPKTAAFGVDWAIHKAVDAGISGGTLRPVIVVGIYNSKQRVDEYTPTSDARHKGGKADEYIHFLKTEVKSFIDESYHTSHRPEDTCVLGSSLGGLLSLYAGWRYPETFGAVAALSPSLWWAGRDMITHIGGAELHQPKSRIYVDVGTRESNDDHNSNGVADVLDDLRTLRAVLIYHGYRLGENLWYDEITGAAHTESDWAARVGKVLETLFPPLPT